MTVLSRTGNPPVLTYKKQSDGYICRQRTRIDKPSSGVVEYSKIIFLNIVLVACCLFAFLYITHEDLGFFQMTSSSSHYYHQHHHKNGYHHPKNSFSLSSGGVHHFLRNQLGARIVASATSKFDSARLHVHNYLRQDELLDQKGILPIEEEKQEEGEHLKKEEERNERSIENVVTDGIQEEKE